MVELQRQDIQGLIVSSYKHLPCAAYVLLRIRDGKGARAWLSQQLQEITTSEGKHLDFSTNIAFTYAGLKNLGLGQRALDTFSRPFQEGMATEHRSRILGDNDENLPAKWDWGGTSGKQVDALLLIYGRDEHLLKAQLERRERELTASGIEEIAALAAGRQPDSHEHFGFSDGIGQPVMDGTGNEERQKRRTHHATTLPPGEFLLGHTNLYKVVADSPMVAAEEDPGQLLPVISDSSTGLHARTGMHDLGRNGTYLVFRQLAQDVAKFWNFLDAATPGPNGNKDPEARERLGAKFVGRWKSGAALVLSPQKDDPALMNENDFAYLDKDPRGLACPIGSHIRRSNPRDSLGPNSKTALDSANRHRIIRRGRSYGDRLKDPFVDDGAKRGLHFICLNSDIERQFEFVQQTWINNPVFGGLDGEVDPLVGNLPKGDCTFTVQGSPLRERIHGLRRFVTVKGGAYFFLPGIAALKYLASL